MFEEWKANNDLFKFHEDLKQKRFSYFLTIQTAFIALYGIVLKEVLIEDNTLLSLSLIFIAFPPLIIVSIYSYMDNRARSYIDTVKGKLLLIEEEWAKRDPESHFSTYTEQFAVLVHRKKNIVERYIKVRGIEKPDPFLKLIETKAAHVGEQNLFLMFKVLWGLFLIVPIAITFLRIWWLFLIVRIAITFLRIL